MPSTIEVVIGDLLQQDVEVIVNAWNRNFLPWWLLLPQGVSGAIKRVAGFAPFRELRKHGTLPAGAAVATGAGRLPFRAIIHVAGLTAFWTSSETIVKACVRNALDLANANGYRSVAFPLIGAGTGGLTPSRVQEVIVEEIKNSAYDGCGRVAARQVTSYGGPWRLVGRTVSSRVSALEPVPPPPLRGGRAPCR